MYRCACGSWRILPFAWRLLKLFCQTASQTNPTASPTWMSHTWRTSPLHFTFFQNLSGLELPSGNCHTSGVPWALRQPTKKDGDRGKKNRCNMDRKANFSCSQLCKHTEWWDILLERMYMYVCVIQVNKIPILSRQRNVVAPIHL